MASVGTMRGTKAQLSCSICQDTLQDMTLSSCFHTFCRKCLDAHIRSTKGRSSYICPVCNTSITLSSELMSGSLRDDLPRPEEVYPGSSPWNENCDICSGRVPAVNRCLECKESFCENCTLVHMRMKASRYHGHRVVPLWGQGSHRRSFDDLQNYCPRHRNEEIIVMCKQCDVLLCLICKLMEHEGHVTRLVSEEAVDMRKRLTDVLQDQTDLSESLHMKKDALHSKKRHVARGLDNELAKIRHHASKLEDQIEKERRDKERELIQHYESLHKDTTDAYETVDDDFGKFEAVSKKAQLLLENDNDVSLVREGPRICEQLKEFEQKHIPVFVGNPTKIFVAGDIDAAGMQNMMGYITERDNLSTTRSRELLHTPSATPKKAVHDSVSQIHAYIVADFQLPFKDNIGYVYGIAPVGNDKAWIIMLGHSEVILADIKGSIIDRVDVGEPCDGVTSDTQGGCFVSCPRSKTVKRIKVFGATKLETLLHDLDEDPHGMATLASELGSEELCICFTKTNDLGCVRSYSFHGNELGKLSPLQAPVRISVDSANNLLCVADHSHGIVSVCDKSGHNIKAMYSGNDGTGFRPLGVCFDQFGAVLIANWQGGTIQRITSDGHLIQNLLVNIDGPQSIALGDSLQLWVGCKQGRVQIFKLQ